DDAHQPYLAAAVDEPPAALADESAEQSRGIGVLRLRAVARAAVDADGRAHWPKRIHSAEAHTPPHSSSDSSTAALAKSFARLDRSCSSKETRSMAASMPLFSSSTMSTI